MRRFAALSLILTLSGCNVGNLHALQESAPQANDFQSSLAAEYLAYAESESDQGHVFSSGYFAHKGLMAEKGEAVEPDEPDDFLADPVKKQLATSRALLLTLLTNDMKHVAPQKAARAQLLFDCWNHQRGSDMAQAPCADEFQAAITELLSISEDMEPGDETTREITFAAKVTSVGPSAGRTIKALVQHIPDMAKFRIELTGYDGQSAQYRALAARRLANIRAAFIAQGIAPERIKIAVGDNSKAVYLSSDAKSPDESPANRNRVKITLVTFTKAAEQATDQKALKDKP